MNGTVNPGDYLCRLCTRHGEKTKAGPGIGPCERGCGRRTGFVLVSGGQTADGNGLRRVSVHG